MRRIWAYQEIDAPAERLWRLLTDLEAWPVWGPTVRRVDLSGARLEEGAVGTVTTVLGAELPFEVTRYDDGARWTWKVAGVPATDHTVEPIGRRRCRVGFGVPWIAAPYLAVCHLALQRLAALANSEVDP